MIPPVEVTSEICLRAISKKIDEGTEGVIIISVLLSGCTTTIGTVPNILLLVCYKIKKKL